MTVLTEVLASSASNLSFSLSLFRLTPSRSLEALPAVLSIPWPSCSFHHFRVEEIDGLPIAVIALAVSHKALKLFFRLVCADTTSRELICYRCELRSPVARIRPSGAISPLARQSFRCLAQSRESAALRSSQECAPILCLLASARFAPSLAKARSVVIQLIEPAIPRAASCQSRNSICRSTTTSCRETTRR